MEINEEKSYLHNFVKNPYDQRQYKWHRKKQWQKLKEELGVDYDRLIARMPVQYMKILSYLGKQKKKDKFRMLRLVIMQYYETIIKARVEKNNGGSSL
jgi:hypothetical protein